MPIITLETLRKERDRQLGFLDTLNRTYMDHVCKAADPEMNEPFEDLDFIEIKNTITAAEDMIAAVEGLESVMLMLDGDGDVHD